MGKFESVGYSFISRVYRLNSHHKFWTGMTERNICDGNMNETTSRFDEFTTFSLIENTFSSFDLSLRCLGVT